jgi:hypothetical protein
MLGYPAPVLKFLRIAVTVLSLTACALLVALWMHSYCRAWFIARGGPWPVVSVLSLQSNCGRMRLNWVRLDNEWEEWPVTWDYEMDAANPLQPDPSTHKAIGFGWRKYDLGFRLYVPYWFLVLSTGGMATICWAQSFRRFSLRTLLIATTLVAVGLGVIVAAR